MTRLQATVALLQAWADYFPHPPTWTGELQRRSVPARSDPKQLGYVRCDQCGGEGCRACWFKGSFVGDPYLAERGILPGSFLSHVRFVNCSTCGGWGRLSADSNRAPRHHGDGVNRPHEACDECLGLGRVPAPAGGVFRLELGASSTELTGDQTLDALERGHLKRDDLGVYQHLSSALTELKTLDRYGHLLVEWVWIMGAQTPESLPPRGLVRLVNGTRTVEAGMPVGFERKLPGEVRAQVEHRLAMRSRAKGWAQAKGLHASRAHQDRNGVKRDERDAEIRRLYASGSWTQERLAERFGLTQQAVSLVLKR